MKKKYLFSLLVGFLSLFTYSQITITPSAFNATDQITITVSFASATCNTMGTSPAKVYMHAGVGDDTNAFGIAAVGNWGTDDGVGLMTNNGNGTWSKTITPSTYFGLNATQQANVTKLGMVFRNADGTQTLKLAPSCSDFIFNVGLFQVTLTSPAANSSTIISSGGSLNIQAANTNGNASYNLKSNGVSINSASSISTYSFNHTNITANQSYELEVTQGTTTLTKKFTAIVNSGVISQALPVGVEDGINYNLADATRATLVLDAPGKDFVYVAGSFNNWQPDANYAMKKDPATGKFWLELTGLTSSVNNTYQYWVVDATPLVGSPALVKTADPYSTLVLSPFDDPGIPAANYPNLPVSPVGQEREVTVLQTGQTAYSWSAATTNFVKPEKEKLVVYELLVRDFDAHKNFQDVINRIDYFKNLHINAIELLPVMEFEGNESWGYNTSFHMALDKFYGTSEKLKELIDLCHQNGIAVILDVALNHAFGRNPMSRMWMNDPDGDGWGSPSSENPYFNTVAKHSYSVGEDFNHQQPRTQYYVHRVIKHWIEEYKIDGFRWDLTKGFTQECTANDEACTNGYRADRVAVLKSYADYSWSLDPTHYTIFEHLGTDAEEQQWANYRINETPSKGVMLWGKMVNEYNNLSMGYTSNIARMNSSSRGFTKNRLMGYAESHDEERLMYKNLQFGNSTNTSHNVKTLNTALSRMSAIGAVSLLIPGPKMIWHFGELGYEDSIFTCNNGIVNTPTDASSGDCKLDTKPQNQWINNWLDNDNRYKIYADWAKIIKLKTEEAVFSGTVTMTNSSSLSQNIKITNASLPDNTLKQVLIIANFDVTTQNVATGFPYAGEWFNLMDNTTLNVTNVNAPIAIPAGQFRIYGNKPAFSANVPFALPSDNFTVESKSETCVNKNNGEIIITAAQTYNYVAHINGANYNFTNSLTVPNLASGSYPVCITIDGKTFEQCFTVTINKGTTLNGKSTFSSDKLTVEITEGTLPYQVFLNGSPQFETDSANFTVQVQKGDLLEVKSAKPCEGVYTKSIVGDLGSIVGYPNPTHGLFEIAVPTSDKEVTIGLYSLSGQLVSKGTYPVQNQKVQLHLEKESAGVYVLKVCLENPVSLTIIKR
ncbi:alpha-amylase family glycosyl hydrolase [Flavobacterium undicola]|uniref:alpha-amylase family glycosyl hydrolase n=1 Tax=Flavobacterium undicola TaxID=1932779 RepID=UPI0013789B99|nr:alpha-amylase family glycosyl hydrolase [Flavobacterium undicola]MBA0882702.1 T9SS type A sorting domain-containing protein [Flavobacterium undicola]